MQLPDFMARERLALPDFCGLCTCTIPDSKWHWSCASRYCKASWKTEGEYYTLTKVALASKPVVDAYLFVLRKTINEVNLKRKVICTQHWPEGVRKNLEDPPSIKYKNVQGKETKEGREHWNCAAALFLFLAGCYWEGIGSLFQPKTAAAQCSLHQDWLQICYQKDV